MFKKFNVSMIFVEMSFACYVFSFEGKEEVLCGVYTIQLSHRLSDRLSDRLSVRQLDERLYGQTVGQTGRTDSRMNVYLIYRPDYRTDYRTDSWMNINPYKHATRCCESDIWRRVMELTVTSTLQTSLFQVTKKLRCLKTSMHRYFWGN